MGGICSSNNAVSVIETETYTDTEQPRTNAELESFLDDLNTTSESSIAEWKQRIQSLTSNRKQLAEYALSKKRKQLPSIDDLILFLKSSPATNNMEKAWVIYVWITHNMQYDAYGFRTGNMGAQDAETAFNAGKCVCDGYANLFKSMCDHLSIECAKISGYAKGFGYTSGMKFTKVNHSWNGLRLDNKWCFIDSTWASGHVDASFIFNEQFKPFYFGVPPQVLVYSHFSVDSDTTLSQTKTKLTLTQFEELPFFTLDYFIFGLKCINHSICRITSASNPLLVEFTADPATKLIGHLENERYERIAKTVVDQRDSKTHRQALIVTLPERNRKYFLKMFAARKYVNSTSENSSDKSYTYVGEFIVSRSKDEVNTNMPKYSIVFDNGMQMISHSSALIFR